MVKNDYFLNRSDGLPSLREQARGRRGSFAGLAVMAVVAARFTEWGTVSRNAASLPTWRWEAW